MDISYILFTVVASCGGPAWLCTHRNRREQIIAVLLCIRRCGRAGASVIRERYERIAGGHATLALPGFPLQQ